MSSFSAPDQLHNSESNPFLTPTSQCENNFPAMGGDDNLQLTAEYFSPVVAKNWPPVIVEKLTTGDENFLPVTNADFSPMPTGLLSPVSSGDTNTLHLSPRRGDLSILAGDIFSPLTPENLSPVVETNASSAYVFAPAEKSPLSIMENLSPISVDSLSPLSSNEVSSISISTEDVETHSIVASNGDDNDGIPVIKIAVVGDGNIFDTFGDKTGDKAECDVQTVGTKFRKRRSHVRVASGSAIPKKPRMSKARQSAETPKTGAKIRSSELDREDHPAGIQIDDNTRFYPLPGGWMKHCSRRKTGKTAGHWDVYLRTPCGVKIRSNLELDKYLKKNPNVLYDPVLTRVSRPRDLPDAILDICDKPAFDASHNARAERGSGGTRIRSHAHSKAEEISGVNRLRQAPLAGLEATSGPMLDTQCRGNRDLITTGVNDKSDACPINADQGSVVETDVRAKPPAEVVKDMAVDAPEGNSCPGVKRDAFAGSNANHYVSAVPQPADNHRAGTNSQSNGCVGDSKGDGQVKHVLKAPARNEDVAKASMTDTPSSGSCDATATRSGDKSDGWPIEADRGIGTVTDIRVASDRQDRSVLTATDAKTDVNKTDRSHVQDNSAIEASAASNTVQTRPHYYNARGTSKAVRPDGACTSKRVRQPANTSRRLSERVGRERMVQSSSILDKEGTEPRIIDEATGSSCTMNDADPLGQGSASKTSKTRKQSEPLTIKRKRGRPHRLTMVQQMAGATRRGHRGRACFRRAKEPVEMPTIHKRTRSITRKVQAMLHPYQCGICERPFRHTDKLKLHVDECISSQPTSSAVVAPEVEAGSEAQVVNYHCYKCTYSTPDSVDMLLHFNKDHSKKDSARRDAENPIHKNDGDGAADKCPDTKRSVGQDTLYKRSLDMQMAGNRSKGKQVVVNQSKDKQVVDKQSKDKRVVDKQSNYKRIRNIRSKGMRIVDKLSKDEQYMNNRSKDKQGLDKQSKGKQVVDKPSKDKQSVASRSRSKRIVDNRSRSKRIVDNQSKNNRIVESRPEDKQAGNRDERCIIDEGDTLVDGRTTPWDKTTPDKTSKILEDTGCTRPGNDYSLIKDERVYRTRYPCPLCGERFSTKISFDVHKKACRPKAFCPFCSIGRPSKAILKRHMSYWHSMSSEEIKRALETHDCSSQTTTKQTEKVAKEHEKKGKAKQVGAWKARERRLLRCC